MIKKKLNIKVNIFRILVLLFLIPQLSKANTKADSLKFIISKQNNDMPKALFDLAEYYYYQSEYNQALESYKKLLDYSKKTKNQPYYIRSLLGLGNIYLDIEKNDYAHTYLKKCINESKRAKDTLFIAYGYNSLANCYRNINKTDSALYFYKKARLLFQIKDEKRGLAGVNNNIANYYFRNKNYKLAIKHYLKSLNVAIELDIKKDQCLYYVNIGAAYKKLNKIDSAIININKSIEIAKETGIKLFISRGYNELYHIYKEKGNLKKALFFFEQHNILSDSIFNDKLKQEIANIKAEAEIQKKSDEIKLLQKQNELDYVKIKNQWYAIFSLVLSTILLILSIFLIIKRRKIKEEKLQNKLNTEEIKNKLREKEYELLKEKSDSKSRELTTITIINTQKKELLLSMKNTIEIFEKQNDIKLLHELKQQIDDNIRIENDWEVFKLHFEEVHPDFFKKLKTSFPDLTQNNLKLCAYIKIGLSNKEIARLLNITPDSVKMAKKRLKVKLNIAPGSDFTF